MITLNDIYLLAGAILACVTVLILRDRSNPRRFTTALFWGIYAAAFLLGSYIPAFWNGILGIALAVVVGLGGVRAGQHIETPPHERVARAERLGSRLLIPALAIPIVTLGCAIGGKYVFINGRPVLETANVTLISLGIGSVCRR